MKIELTGHYTLRRILTTMVPSVLMMLVTSVYSIVDGWFVSNFVGSTQFAAVNLVYPALMMIGSIGIMIGSGGCALVAKTLGEGNPLKANKIFSMLIEFTIVTAAVFSTIFYLFANEICALLGADGALQQHCVDYSRIIIVCMPAFMLQMAFQSFFMAAEKPQLGAVMSIASGVTNIVLDAVFIIIFKWGLEGAALATALAQLLGGIYPLYYFSSKRNTSRLKFSLSAFQWKPIAKTCTNGSSEFVGNIAFSLASMCYNWQLIRYAGENGVAAFGVIMYVGFIFTSVFIGYNISMAPVIAYNFGACNNAELKSLLRKSMLLLTIFGLTLTALAEVFSGPIALMFVGYDSALTEFTTHAFRIYMISNLLVGFNMFTSAFFTALNNGVVSAFAAFTRSIIFEISAVFLLPLWLGIDGIWLSITVAEALSLIVSLSLLLAFRRRYGY